MVRANLGVAVTLHGAEHRHTLGTMMNLGLLLDGQGKRKEAAAIYTELVETQRRVLGEEHRDTILTSMHLAGAVLHQGHNADAEARYRTILEVQMRVLGPSDPSTLTCQMNLASAVLNQARYKEAEELYRANLEAKLRRLGPEHVDTLMASMNLGSVLKERGDYLGAEHVFSENYISKKAVLGVGHADTCFAALNLVGVWVDGQRVERYVDAEALAKSSHETLSGDFGQSHPSTLTAAMHHGMALHVLGKHVEAAEVLRAVHDSQVQALGGESHPDVLETAWRLGAVLAAPGTAVSDGEAAVTLLRATASRYSNQLGKNHPRTLRASVLLGEALVRMGTGSMAEAASIFEACEAALHPVVDKQHPDLLKCQALAAKHRACSAMGEEAHARLG